MLRSVLRTIWVDMHQGVWAVLANTVTGSHLVPRAARILFLRVLGVRVGNSHVLPQVYFTSRRVVIGDGVFINRFCMFDGHGVTLHDKVALGQGVRFITASHEIASAACRAGEGFSKPVVVGRGTWIGTGATVLPGVVIGSGCVVAAGSVVTTDLPDNGLYGGVPAKLIRELS